MDMQVTDLTTRFNNFADAMDCEKEEALALFARCEEYREKAEASPLIGLSSEMSREVLLQAWANKAHLQAYGFPDGHPDQLEKLKLRDALQAYAYMA